MRPRGAPLRSRQQVPQRGPRPAARARPRLPSTRPGPALPGGTHLILEPMVPGPPHGPAGPARRFAGRPASLRRSLRPFLPFLKQEPARSRVAPSLPLLPPPPGVKVLAPAQRTPWSPARVLGARHPHRSHTAAPSRPRSRPRGLLGSVVRSRGSSLEREIEISAPLLSGRIHTKRPEETSMVTPEATEEAFIHANVESSCQAKTWGV